MQYRRKPGPVVEAMQWNGSQDNDALREFAGHWVSIGDFGVSITTPEGTMLVRQGDWIIRGAKGEFHSIRREFHVCKSDDFERTYEPQPKESLP